MSKYGVFLVRIFPHLEWIWRDTQRYSVRMRENTNKKKLHIWALFTKCHILSTEQISLSDCFYFLSSWSVAIYCNCLLTSLWRHESLKYSFLSNQAGWISSEQKELLRGNKKYFSSFSKGVHWNKVKKLVGEIPTLNILSKASI